MFQNLTKYYGDFCAVDGISLTIEPSRILGLLGPNGAGKITTLRMLTGFYTPTSGTIRINDLKMPEDTLKIKSMIGYLPESAPLYHNMLVYDYLDYVARLKGWMIPGAGCPASENWAGCAGCPVSWPSPSAICPRAFASG